MSVNTKMTAIADAIRNKTGRTDTLTLDEMATSIEGIETGIDTSDATAQATDILNGKTAYVGGEKVTGTIQSRGSSDITNWGATVTAKAGYYPEDTDMSLPAGSVGIATIEVSDSGLITATPYGNMGFIYSGTDTPGTKQLDTQEAKTITPTKSTQTAVASKKYTTGAITVAPIPNNYITTTDATAAANEILSGETAYVNGSKVTGTMTNNGAISSTMDGINTKSVTVPAGYTSGGTVSLTDDIDNEVDTQADLISQITTALENKAAGGVDTSDATATASDILASKTAYVKGSKVTGTIASKGTSDLIQSGPVVVVPAGYYPNEVNKNVGVGSVPNPTITVRGDGLITATSTVTQGYVTGGDKTATKQLPVLGTNGYTPTTTQQVISSGQYLVGDQYIAGDANLIPANIAEGVSIFGVTGTHSGGGGTPTIKTFTCDVDKAGGELILNRPFIDGMTWQEYVNSALNFENFNGTMSDACYILDNNYIKIRNGVGGYSYVSTDGTATGRVLKTDAINAIDYSNYTDNSGWN